MAKRTHEISPDTGHRCTLCNKRVADINLVSKRGTGDGTMCDSCVDALRAVNGFTPMGTRDYSRFHEPEPVDPEVVRARVRKYRITMEKYEAMLAEQENRCAICTVQPRRLHELYIDHNHTTGKVRGLLCSLCNTALGMFRDSPDLLDAALTYLEDRGAYGVDSAQEEAS